MGDKIDIFGYSRYSGNSSYSNRKAREQKRAKKEMVHKRNRNLKSIAVDSILQR